MDLGSLIFIVVIGIILVIAFVHYTGGSGESEDRDPGRAIMEYQRAYPDEAIRDACMTADGKASFFRLASGKTGFIQSMGRHSVCRLIEPGAVTVTPLQGKPGLAVDFHETAFPGGDYVFRKQADAANIAHWLLDGFAMQVKSGDQGEPATGGDDA